MTREFLNIYAKTFNQLFGHSLAFVLVIDPGGSSPPCVYAVDSCGDF
jgi:hypothetical protein